MNRPHGIVGVEVTIVLATGLAVAALAAETSPQPSPMPWIAPKEAAPKQNPVQADASSVAEGKNVYSKKCLACHGRAGKGDGPTAPRLKIVPGDLSDPKMWRQTDGELFWKITQSKTPMPSYRQGLSDKERWTVVNYIRTLAPRPTGSSSPTRESSAAASSREASP